MNVFRLATHLCLAAMSLAGCSNTPSPMNLFAPSSTNRTVAETANLQIDAQTAEHLAERGLALVTLHATIHRYSVTGQTEALKARATFIRIAQQGSPAGSMKQARISLPPTEPDAPFKLTVIPAGRYHLTALETGKYVWRSRPEKAGLNHAGHAFASFETNPGDILNLGTLHVWANNRIDLGVRLTQQPRFEASASQPQGAPPAMTSRPLTLAPR